MAIQLYVGSTDFHIVSHVEGEKLMCVRGSGVMPLTCPQKSSYPVNDSR